MYSSLVFYILWSKKREVGKVKDIYCGNCEKASIIRYIKVRILTDILSTYIHI